MAGVGWRGASLRVGFASAVRIAWRSAAAPPVYAVRLPRRSSPSPATQQPQREQGGGGKGNWRVLGLGGQGLGGRGGGLVMVVPVRGGPHWHRKVHLRMKLDCVEGAPCRLGAAARRAREVHWSNGDPVRVTEPGCGVWRSRYLPTS